MTVTTTLDTYIQNLEIEFSCFQADGTTPLDLTGGSAHLRIVRGGLYPFEVNVDTETGTEGEDYDWTNRAQGTGIFYALLDLLDPQPTPGYCRYILTSTTALGDVEPQAVGWMKLKSGL